jgi:hypothetical protein
VNESEVRARWARHFAAQLAAAESDALLNRSAVVFRAAAIPPPEVRGGEAYLLLSQKRRAHTAFTSAGRKLRLEVLAGSAGARTHDTLSAAVSQMFRLDEDLSGFYALVGADVELDWCARGADARRPCSKTS